MQVMYMQLHKWEDYKAMEDQMRAFKETSHQTTPGFYHKSIRIRFSDDLIIEFHGPMVGGYGHIEDDGGAVEQLNKDHFEEI